MEGTQLGESLTPLSAHLGELNTKSIEGRCRMVKHCRVDTTVQPTQCRVPLAVEVPSLRSVVESRWKRCREKESTDRVFGRHWHECSKIGWWP